jgi:hypothetical protein
MTNTNISILRFGYRSHLLYFYLDIWAYELAKPLSHAAMSAPIQVLKYKDFELSHVLYEVKSLFVLKITLLQRKHTTTSTKFCLYENPKFRFLCPVTYFIGSALGDGFSQAEMAIQ